MIYSAMVESIGGDTEEEISIVVQGERLVCFASYLPYLIEVGRVYQFEFLPMVFNEYIVGEIEDILPSIFRIGNSYSYLAVGKLENGYLSCGAISFFDEVLLTDFYFLNGKMVSWKIDRLDISLA